MQSGKSSSTAFVMYTCLATLLSAYFAYAAVRGDLGVIERLVITSQIEDLKVRRDAMAADIAALRNKTRRLSDGYLDLDLLDEQARSVLGMMRADELVIHETDVTGR